MYGFDIDWCCVKSYGLTSRIKNYKMNTLSLTPTPPSSFILVRLCVGVRMNSSQISFFLKANDNVYDVPVVCRVMEAIIHVS